MADGCEQVDDPSHHLRAKYTLKWESYRHFSDKNIEFVIIVKSDVVYCNQIPYRDDLIVSRAVDLCVHNFDKAVMLLKEHNKTSKTSLNKRLSMRLKGVNLSIDCSGTNDKVKVFYEDFKTQLLNILEDNNGSSMG